MKKKFLLLYVEFSKLNNSENRNAELNILRINDSNLNMIFLCMLILIITNQNGNEHLFDQSLIAFCSILIVKEQTSELSKEKKNK